MATARTRGYAFVLYPESAPENWRLIIDEFHIQWAESPLHELDVDPGTGELKKPHWHICLNFDSLKTLDQVKKLIAPLNGTIPIPLNSVRGMIRYFAHLDNPEKYQYPIDQIIGHGGMDVQDLLRLSASARYAVIRKMCDYVRESNITEFYQLMDYAMSEKFEEWFPLLCDNSAYVVNQYIKSNRERVTKEILKGRSNYES